MNYSKCKCSLMIHKYTSGFITCLYKPHPYEGVPFLKSYEYRKPYTHTPNYYDEHVSGSLDYDGDDIVGWR